MTGRPGAPPNSPPLARQRTLVSCLRLTLNSSCGPFEGRAGRTKNLSVVGADGPERREIDGNRCHVRRILACAAFPETLRGKRKREKAPLSAPRSRLMGIHRVVTRLVSAIRQILRSNFSKVIKGEILALYKILFTRTIDKN